MSKYKYRALCWVSINFSSVFLATVVLPVILDFDNFSWSVLIWGVIELVIFLLFALEFAEKGKL